MRPSGDPGVPPGDGDPGVPQGREEPGGPRRDEVPETSRQAQPYTHRIGLTGRGAVLVMLVVFALGLIGASWLRWPVLAGASFVAGSAAAVSYVRRGDLLTVTITPPLLFCIVLVGVKAGTATGNVLLSVAEGAAITLAGAAPWLFAGTALYLIIAWARGLRGCVRELRQDLRPADRRSGPAGR
jgi:uncharacterized protein DUF6542